MGRLPGRPSRHAAAKDHEWLLECLAHRHEPAWVEQQWARLQDKAAPDWKRLAVARSARKLGLRLILSEAATRIYVHRRLHGEPGRTWAALVLLAREGVQVPAV